MADANSIDDIIATEAALPQTSQSDGQLATGQSLTQLIEVSKHIAAKAALSGTNSTGGARSAWSGLRAAKGLTPSAD